MTKLSRLLMASTVLSGLAGLAAAHAAGNVALPQSDDPVQGSIILAQAAPPPEDDATRRRQQRQDQRQERRQDNQQQRGQCEFGRCQGIAQARCCRLRRSTSGEREKRIQIRTRRP